MFDKNQTLGLMLNQVPLSNENKLSFWEENPILESERMWTSPPCSGSSLRDWPRVGLWSSVCDDDVMLDLLVLWLIDEECTRQIHAVEHLVLSWRHLVAAFDLPLHCLGNPSFPPLSKQRTGAKKFSSVFLVVRAIFSSHAAGTPHPRLSTQLLVTLAHNPSLCRTRHHPLPTIYKTPSPQPRRVTSLALFSATRESAWGLLCSQ